MRHALLGLLFAALPAFAQLPPPPSPPAAPPGLKGAELLPALIEHSRSRLVLQDGRLAGEGLPALRQLLAPTQFLLLGEDHFIRGVAEFATALWGELHDLGYRHAVLEADRWSVAALEAELAAGRAIAPWLNRHGGGIAMPFYALDAELDWLRAIVAARPAPKGPRLWGVDQVFLGSVPIVLEAVAAKARDPEARRLAAEQIAAARGSLNWLSKESLAPLQALLQRLDAKREPDLHERVSALIASRAIYQPFSGGEGEAWAANDAREQGMRRDFLRAYREAEKREGAPPKVMAKLGANHLFRGASTTSVQSFGNAMVELARSRDRHSLSLIALCAPGGRSGNVDGGELPCDAARYGGDWAFIEPFLLPDVITVFDLRSWRLRPGRFAHLPVGVQRVVAGFDLLLFVPSGRPARYLEGVAPPKP